MKLIQPFTREKIIEKFFQSRFYLQVFLIVVFVIYINYLIKVEQARYLFLAIVCMGILFAVSQTIMIFNEFFNKNQEDKKKDAKRKAESLSSE